MSIRITGSASGLDTDSMVQELVKAYDEKGANYTKTRTKTEWKQEAWATLNTKVKSFYSKYASNMRFSESYTKKSTTVSDSSKASIVASANAVNGTQSLNIVKLAKVGYLTGSELKEDANGKAVTKATTLSDLGYNLSESTEVKIGQGKLNESGEYAGYKKFEVDGSTTIEEFTKYLSEAGYTANFDEANGRFFISAKESGADNNFTFVGGAAATDLLGLTNGEEVKIDGEDAVIELNKAKFTSSTNTFNINGLTITAKGVTGEEGDPGMDIITDTDYDSIYDNIKNFLKEYNSIINELDKLYNADSAKGYDPLTDEEKDALSDAEVDKWEKKIKDSLLRRDSDVDTLASAMRNSMMKAIEIDGTTYSLSSFGINTLSYFNAADNEKNALHIDGDPDDPDSSGNDDKLKTMIATNPDVVQEFFTQLSTGLYDSMYAIQSRSDNYTSFGSFYSDKKLTSDYTEQTKQIDKWEKYVADIEEKYYKQFAAMESSLSSMQSQQSYISQLFA